MSTRHDAAPETLTELVASLAEVPAERGVRFVSPRFEESFVPWSGLHALVLQEAAHLRDQGVAAGDRVVLPLTTDPAFASAFLAIVWLGAIPVSVGGQMAGQARDAYLERLAALRRRHAFEHVVLEPKLAAVALDSGAIEEDLLRQLLPAGRCFDAGVPELAPHAARPEDVAFVQFSSGSTSDPKGVVIRHRNLCTNVRLICQHDGRREDSSGVMWVPLYHDMGLVGGFLSPMLHAHPLVLLHPTCFLMKPLSWLEHLSRWRGTVSACPNFALDMCVERIPASRLERAGLDLSAVEFIYDGAEPVSPESVLRFEERLAPHGLPPGRIQPAYGMAEASLAVTVRPAGAPLKSREVEGTTVVSVGAPIGDFEVRVVDGGGSELPPGEVGEIQVRGASIAEGYFDDAESTAQRFQGGWHRAGDLGLLDEDGELFVTGRKKDLIIVGGRNFYGHDLAASLDELPFLQRGQHHVFSFVSEDGERVVALTVLDRRAAKEGLARLEASLESGVSAWVRGRMGEIASSWLASASPGDVEIIRDHVQRFLLEQFGLAIHDVVVVRRIPRTPSGKVRRQDCEHLYREHVASRSGSEEES